MCFVDLEKAFDGVTKKVVEWAMRKKGIPEESCGMGNDKERYSRRKL